MRNIYSLFLLIAVLALTSCQKKAGYGKEEFDALSEKQIETESRLAALEEAIATLQLEMEGLKPGQSAAAKKSVSTDEGSKTKWVEWGELSGAGRKYYNAEPYTGGFTQYAPNRVKLLTGYFTNGYRSGKWTYYNKNGSVKDVKYY